MRRSVARFGQNERSKVLIEVKCGQIMFVRTLTRQELMEVEQLGTTVNIDEVKWHREESHLYIKISHRALGSSQNTYT